MIATILTILIVGVVIFELIEHILFPLVWSFVIRNRKSSCGIDGMPGKVVEVRDWRDGEGRIFFEGELWMAVSGDPLRPGDKAVVQQVDGLVLKIASLRR
ncbi:MAG: NfeD family protein [Syntrophobacter sp.]